MSLVEAVKQAEQETRTKLLEKYRELLNRNDSGDVKALRQVMDKLGIAADRLERDLSTVQRAAQLEAEAAKADDPALDAAKNAASKAYSDYREESERISRERKAEEDRLYQESHMLCVRQNSGCTARIRLKELLDKHPDLFGLEEPKPEPPRPVVIMAAPSADDVIRENERIVREGRCVVRTGTLVKLPNGSATWMTGAGVASHEKLTPEEEERYWRGLPINAAAEQPVETAGTEQDVKGQLEPQEDRPAM